MTIHHPAAEPATGTVTTTGTLTVLVPRATWRHMTRRWRPDRAALARGVHDFIRSTLIPEADKMLAGMCRGAGARFTPDRFDPKRDADRHGLTVHGRLVLSTPRDWGLRLITPARVWFPSDARIAADLHALAADLLIGVFNRLLAVQYPGAIACFHPDPESESAHGSHTAGPHRQADTR